MERGMTLAEKQTFLPYGHQWIDDEDIAAVVAVLKGDWLTMGPAVDAFENALAEKVGTRYAVSFSSGTAGTCTVPCMPPVVGHGDEVIVPPMTFAATSNAALYLGGLPRFADIAPEDVVPGSGSRATGRFRPDDGHCSREFYRISSAAGVFRGFGGASWSRPY